MPPNTERRLGDENDWMRILLDIPRRARRRPASIQLVIHPSVDFFLLQEELASGSSEGDCCGFYSILVTEAGANVFGAKSYAECATRGIKTSQDQKHSLSGQCMIVLSYYDYDCKSNTMSVSIL